MTTFTWITPAKTGAPGGRNPDLALSVSCRRTKREGTRLRFSIYPPVMKLMGWEPGDQIQIGLSDSYDAIALRKVQEGGYKMREDKSSTGLVALAARAPAGLTTFKAQRILRNEIAQVQENTLLVNTQWLADLMAPESEPEVA